MRTRPFCSRPSASTSHNRRSHDFGHRAPDATTPEALTTVASLTAGQATSSAITAAPTAEALTHANPLATHSSNAGLETTGAKTHAKGKSSTTPLKVKQRTLKERASDPADPRRVCRDLTQELLAEASGAKASRQDPADAHRMDADDEDELFADPPPQGPRATATTTPAAPPESEAMDFRTRMEDMTSRQSNAIRNDINIVATPA